MCIFIPTAVYKDIVPGYLKLVLFAYRLIPRSTGRTILGIFLHAENLYIFYIT